MPTLLATAGRRIPPLPALWIVSALCLAILTRDPTFDRRLLWNAHALPRYLPGIVSLFAVLAALIALSIWRLAPALLFELPRRHARLWALIMCLYPVLSVYPQGIVYRAFLFHRYAALMGSTDLLVAASAAAFGYMHIVFRNKWAVAFSTVGGFIFAGRYAESHSLFVSSFEHALYGCLMFTIGLGSYFFHSSVRAAR